MIIEQRLSSQLLAAPLLLPNPQPALTTSLHRGGVALNDSSQGLDVQTWTLSTDGTDVKISATSVPESVLFSGSNITEVCLAFDQNMRPFVAFVEDGQAKYRWFDTQDGQIKITTLPAGTITPRCTLDDRRQTQLGASDIILTYLRNNALYFRAQRDRYTIEYLLRSNAGTGLLHVGLNSGNRLQWLLAPI